MRARATPSPCVRASPSRCAAQAGQPRACRLLQVVKRLWEYIKEHGLQDPKDKRTIIFGEGGRGGGGRQGGPG